MTFLQKHHGQMSDSMLTAFFIILSGGLQDAYTYCCRGKVFANAQTGNIVLLSTHLFEGDWGQALRYLVPVLAFLLGIYIAECIHRHFKRMEKVHWRQLIILAEIVLLAAVGFLGTGRGAVARPAVREKDAAADRAEPGFRGGALGGQPRLQHRVKGQNGIPEVAAIAPRPAFPQHIALAVQR